MDVLNLANKEASDVKYEVSCFPDGQQQVKINSRFVEGDVVSIKARLSSFRDLELICCAVASLNNLGIKRIILTVPYFLGARSDRKFERGTNHYLKEVLCPIINGLNLERVAVLDPHSDVLEACLNNFRKIDNTSFVRRCLLNLYGQLDVAEIDRRTVLLSPDAGALKKVQHVADNFSLKHPVIVCSKSRDVEGQLSNVVVPLKQEDSHKDIIIIDDICDGGATFIKIAEKIKSLDFEFHGRLFLIVTHGVFSKGYRELEKHFEKVFCTNSFKEDYLYNSFEHKDQGVKPEFLDVLNIYI